MSLSIARPRARLWQRAAGWAAALPGQAALPLATERGRLAPWLAVALGIGVLVYFALPAEPRLLPSLGLAAPLVALAIWAGLRQPLAGWALGLVAAGALGFAAAAWSTARQPPMPDLPRGAVVITAEVAAVELLPEGRRVTLSGASLDGGAPLARSLRVRLKADDPLRPAPGDTIRLRALVRAPSAPAYPGAWDFQRAAFFGGLAGHGFALGRAEMVAAAPAAAGFAGLRAVIEARVTAQIPGSAGAIAAALLTGGQSGIAPEALAAMRDSGLAHLLSVSGLHIVIVMGVAFGALRLGIALIPWLALRVPGKAVAAVGALAVGGAYMLLTGSQVPMQRSFATACVTTLALLAGRRALSLRGLALAAAAVLLVQPSAVLGASFQMSFAAVLALIAGWDWLRPHLPPAAPGWAGWRRRLALAAFGVAATSLLAGVATTPFGLHHFGRLQLYGVAANAIAVPITSVLVMPAGMAAAALMPLGLEGLALAPMGWGVEAILVVARMVASWPGAALTVPPIPAWGLACCAFGLCWLGLWRARWRLLGVPLMLVGLGSGALDRPPDVLVAGDGKLIAFRTAEGMALQKLSGASKLTREVWLRRYGEPPLLPLPRGAGGLADGAVTCAVGACTYRAVPDGPVAVLLRGARPAEACAGAALVVSAEPVRGRCGAAVIDRFAVWRNGPHAAWLGPEGVTVVSDRAARGARPWVPPPPVPRAAALRTVVEPEPPPTEPAGE